jgi:uncharacterized protein YbjT (DUF2867 family)
MSVVVTGATGHLGRLAVEALLRRGVPGGQIVATGRRTETLDDLAARGVAVRRADFEDPQSLREAFTGAERPCSSPPTRSADAPTSTPTPSVPRRTRAWASSPTPASRRRTAPR